MNSSLQAQAPSAPVGVSEPSAFRASIERIVAQYEDGEKHDEGAYDSECETCRILADLRFALGIDAPNTLDAAALSKPSAEGGE